MKPATVRYGVKCIVPLCNNKMSENWCTSYFSFPKDPIRRSMWVEKCGIDGNIDVSKKHIKVCGEHFENCCFLNDLKNRLQPHAVPTLFTDMTSQDKIPILPLTLDHIPKTYTVYTSMPTSTEILAFPLDVSRPGTSLNFSLPCKSKSTASDSSFDSPLAYSSPSSDKSTQTLEIWSDKTPRKNVLRAKLKLEKEKRQQAESSIVSLSNQLAEFDTVENCLRLCEKYFDPGVLTIIKSHILQKKRNRYGYSISDIKMEKDVIDDNLFLSIIKVEDENINKDNELPLSKISDIKMEKDVIDDNLFLSLIKVKDENINKDNELPVSKIFDIKMEKNEIEGNLFLSVVKVENENINKDNELPLLKTIELENINKTSGHDLNNENNLLQPEYVCKSEKKTEEFNGQMKIEKDLDDGHKFESTITVENNDVKFIERAVKKINSFNKSAIKSKSGNVCDFCNRSFSSKTNMTKHIRIHTGEKPYVCSVCNKSFSGSANLRQHTRGVHNKEKPYTCDICNKSCFLKSALLMHMRSHTGERPYKCSFCYKSFVSKSYVNIHMRVHTGEKPFKCEICNKSFTLNTTLKLHTMSVHTREKHVKCSICNKAFVHKKMLAQHMRIHTGENPYTCDVCNKSFTQKSNLRRHMPLHTGERSYYPCNLCNKLFTVKSGLIIHMRSHTGERPYICSGCNKSFTSASALTSHKQIHTQVPNGIIIR